jgi:hypothetical protein
LPRRSKPAPSFCIIPARSLQSTGELIELACVSKLINSPSTK